MTSPGAVYKNILIIASRVNESYDASPGHIRALRHRDRRAEMDLSHHPAARASSATTRGSGCKGENYGGANAWGGVTIDEQRGWVFAATGSATEDFYGGFRKGDNLFANCVLALDATTGERKWHYQTVRHDIWDYDNPPAPILVTIGSARDREDAVVQLTKMGFTFVLDRDTGKPLFPVQEVPVPRSDVPGEETSPTQPFPLKPQPLVRQIADRSRSDEHHARGARQCAEGFPPVPARDRSTRRRACRARSPRRATSAERSGTARASIRVLNMLYVNVNESRPSTGCGPCYGAPGTAEPTPVALGRQIYDRTCAACHGA